MPLTLRRDKGSPLTHDEGDDNWQYLDSRVDTVEANTQSALLSAQAAEQSAIAAAASANSIVATDQIHNLRTRSELEQAQQAMKNLTDRSGFLEFGTGWNEVTSNYDGVNLGISARSQGSELTSWVNQFAIGSNEGEIKANINGIINRIGGIPRADGYVEPECAFVQLPPAPTVTHADSTNSGLVLNGRNFVDTSSWVASGTVVLSVDTGRIKIDATSNPYGNASQGIATEIGVTYRVEANLEAGTSIVRFLIGNSVGAADLYLDANATKINVEFTATATTTYFTIQDSGAGGTLFIGDIAVYPKHEAERTDLAMIEVWHEDISEKGNFVPPYGNVHYLGGDVAGLTGIAAGTFTGADTYSLFSEEWQAAGDLVGKGYDWDLLTDAQKAALAGDPLHGLYKDGDKIIQIRYRVRVIKGLGDGWQGIDPSNSAGVTLSYDDFTTNSVIAKGSRVSIASEFGSSGGRDVFMDSTQTYALVKDDKGIFSLDTRATGVAYKGQCYALPIALLPRLNQGAYHDIFNERGCMAFKNGGVNTTASTWTDSTIYSTVDAFLPIVEYAQDARGRYNQTGFIGASSSDATNPAKVRPDLKFYDAVYADGEGGIIDHRLSAYKNFTHTATGRHIRSGEARGFEGNTTFKKVRDTGNLLYDYGNGTCAFYADTDTLNKYAIGDNVALALYNAGQWYFDQGRITSGGIGAGSITVDAPNISAAVATGYLVADGSNFVCWSGQSENQNSGLMLHRDLIGDPANWYRGQDVTAISGTITVNTGEVLWYKGTTAASGTTGNFYKRTGGNLTVDVTSLDLNNATVFDDLGADWDGAGSWRKNLENGYEMFGTPHLVGENGEDYIVSNPSGTVKLSKKAIEFKLMLYSDDYGVTWGVSAGISIDGTTNKLVGSTVGGNRLAMIFYTTKPETLQPCVNTAVKGEIGDVWAGNSSIVNRGCSFVSDLIKKVSVSALLPIADTRTLEAGVKPEDSKLNVNYGSLKHNTIDLGASNPAVKAFSYQSEDNVHFVFEEMKHNGTSWGDHLNDFSIIDNVGTKADDNGETVLQGQKEVKLKSDQRGE